MKPNSTEKSCKSPAFLFKCCLCHLARSLGSTSLTVTYNNVPPAKACKIGIIVFTSLFGLSAIAIPRTIPPMDEHAKTSIQRKCLQKVVQVLDANSIPKQKPTTSLWDATAASRSRTFVGSPSKPTTNPSNKLCMERATNNPRLTVGMVE